jgi:hypothetical protein
MANYSNINLSVLFIENPRFPWQLTRSVFFLVGIQPIQIANDGALSIEILKRVGDTGEQEGGAKLTRS